MTRLLVVDHRWGGRSLLDEFSQEMSSLGYEVQVRQLETGDLVWGCPLGRVAVEIKQPADLLRSHQDGRLDEQLQRLVRYAAVPILLVWGRLGDSLDIPPVGGFTWTAVDNLLFGRQLSGVMVAHTGDLTLAQRVDGLYRYLERRSGGRRRPPSRQVPLPYMGELTRRAEVIYHLLHAVGGVRDKWELAETLAARYSVRDICSWGPKEWRAAGFSPHMAKKIDRFLSELL